MRFIKKIIPISVLMVLLIAWAVFILDFIIPFFDFNSLGIRPRNPIGLIGVVTSPFLHGGLYHILANTSGLLICGFILKWSYSFSQMRNIIVLGILMSGLLTWAISSSGIVIGASGLVFCFIGLLLANAFFNSSLLSWTQALLCLFFYSGALLSLLSVQQGISWAGHFSGLLSGIALSYMYRNKKEN